MSLGDSGSHCLAIKAKRRDPTTCDREYTPDELEFMQAMEAHIRGHPEDKHCLYNNPSVILSVLQTLGYKKCEPIILSQTAPQ